MQAPEVIVEGKNVKICLNGCGTLVPAGNKKYCSLKCATTVAYAQGYNIKETGKAVTEYCLNPSGGGDWPAYGFSGNKKATISIDALYVDNTYVNMFENNAPITVFCGPLGSSGGNPKTHTAQ